jgi:hypothetical protein
VSGTVLCAIAALLCFLGDDLQCVVLLLYLQSGCLPKDKKNHCWIVDKKCCTSIAELYTSTSAYTGQPVVGVADIQSDRHSA